MATNKPTIQALKKINELIEELNTWNKVLKKHIGQQSRQAERYQKDTYKKSKKKILRIRNNFKVVAKY